MEMIARAEMSTKEQGAASASGAPKVMSVALIGPNDAHRKIVARALASSQGRKVHEFIDYPNKLTDLPRMLEQSFDVVLVDVDTDESYALQIIEKLTELGTAVMAYSARTDQELLMSCMRAGARDFLPLPSGSESEQSFSTSAAPEPAPVAPVPAPKPAVAPPPPVASRPAEPKPASTPVAPVSRSNVTPIVPERRFGVPDETVPAQAAETWGQLSSPQSKEEPSVESSPASSPEKEMSEFDAWDAANLRRLQAPPVKLPEPRHRPSLVPERRKNPEVVTRVTPSVVPIAEPERDTTPEPLMAPDPAIQRPPVAVDIFRSAQFGSGSEPDEAAEKEGAKFVKWILIAAGPLVLILVLLIVFTRPSSPKAATTTHEKQGPAPQQQAANGDSDRLIVNATGKPTPSTPVAAKPSPKAAQESEPEAAPAEPPSPDAMAAQLVAPRRIAGGVKKPVSADEPPPAAPVPVGLGDSNAVPGAVFGSGSKSRIAPHVVPISAGVAEGMLVHKTTPVYPKFAQQAHISGTVMLKATITKQGTIEGVQVISGPKVLASSAVDAVRTWKYRPYMLDGQPVAVETSVMVVFGSK